MTFVKETKTIAASLSTPQVSNSVASSYQLASLSLTVADVTSIPTGVEFSHRNLMNLVSSESGKLGLRPGVKIGAMASVESCISKNSDL